MESVLGFLCWVQTVPHGHAAPDRETSFLLVCLLDRCGLGASFYLSMLSCNTCSVCGYTSEFFLHSIFKWRNILVYFLSYISLPGGIYCCWLCLSLLGPRLSTRWGAFPSGHPPLRPLWGAELVSLLATSLGALLGTSFCCCAQSMFLSLFTASAVCFSSASWRSGGASPVTLLSSGSPCRVFPSFLGTVQVFLSDCL